MENKDASLTLAFQLISLMRTDDFDYIYRGLFTKSITENILNLSEAKLHISDESTSTINKHVYLVMVECLQNITRHQEKPGSKNIEDTALFMIQQKNDRYLITTGNLISNSNIPKLKEDLDKVNGLDVKELKAYYKHMLKTGIISHKGGAGLGLISMARKSRSKLSYSFSEVNDKLSYFYFRVEVLFDPDNQAYESGDTFEKIISIHKILNQENILLNFNGTFNKNNIINLLPIIETQINETINIKNRVLQVMIDMLQNIVNYSVPIEIKSLGLDLEGNPGIFYLSQNKHDFILTAGNYMNNHHIPILKRKLDFVNKLTYDKLITFHDRLFDYFADNEITKPDLSIIEMRLKSKHSLEYRFDKVADEYSFFTIQAII